ncbi:MAG: ABC transporter permease [Thermoplasmata archaeon]|jgi:ABC-2 type transport system permease protein|nr:ABC transporter permease [Thermoplasmata archaeon]
MSDLTNIIRKEVKELLSPGSVISVVVMVILFACIGNLISDEVEKSIEMPVVCVANWEGQEITTEYGSWNAYDALIDIYVDSDMTLDEAKKYVISIEGSADDEDTLLKEMEKADASFALVLSDEFASDIAGEKRATIYQYHIYMPSGMISGTVSSSVSSFMIDKLNDSLSTVLLGPDKAEAKFLTTPIEKGNTRTFINGDAYGDVTPADISNALSNQTMLIPIIIMIIIMMVGSIVISSMGSEKENKTLETLLTLPIKRTTIVTGKIIAAAVIGLLFGLAYMVGMRLYIGSLTSMADTSNINLEDYGLQLTLADYGLITLSMFLAIACALGICMILGAFAKNYRSAQTMTMPLSILAMIPMFITMFSGWYGSNLLIKVLLFVIPFSHPMMAMEALLNDDITLVLSGIAYMALFAVASIFITVRLYKSDLLVTGLSQNKYMSKLKLGKRRQEE